MLRTAASAHCGLVGHRGYTATCEIVKEKLAWNTVDTYIKTFIPGCLVFSSSDNASKFSRQLSQESNAESIREILHFDLFTSESL